MRSRMRYLIRMVSAFAVLFALFSVVNVKSTFAAGRAMAETEKGQEEIQTEDVITYTGAITLTISPATNEPETGGLIISSELHLFDYFISLRGPSTGREHRVYVWTSYWYQPEASYFMCSTLSGRGEWWASEDLENMESGFYTAKYYFTPPHEGEYHITCRVWPSDVDTFREGIDVTKTFFYGEKASEAYLPYVTRQAPVR